ncbi:acetyltransferase [Methylophilaceae bacterium]|nr:acetyltransferase [Methylophilaceae bacterium]
MSKVIIFGLEENSELANFYLEKDSPHDVIAFCVDGQYIQSDNFQGKPVIAFEEVDQIFPINVAKFLAPLSPSNMNRDREGVYNRIKAKGYDFISYVSSYATVLTDKIGDNCFILEDNTIQPFVSIGDNVLIWSGNHIGHHSIIHDHVSFTSHVVLSGRCEVSSYSFLGVNSTVRDGVFVAEGTFLAIGSVLTSDTKPWSVYKSSVAELLKVPSTRVKF